MRCLPNYPQNRPSNSLNSCQHQRTDGVIHHRLIVDGQQLFAYTLGNRVKPRAGASGENYYSHAKTLFYHALLSRLGKVKVNFTLLSLLQKLIYYCSFMHYRLHLSNKRACCFEVLRLRTRLNHSCKHEGSRCLLSSVCTIVHVMWAFIISIMERGLLLLRSASPLGLSKKV